MRLLFIFVAFFTLIVGCFFPADRGQLLENRVDALQVENKKLEEQLQYTRDALTKATARLQEMLKQLDKAARTTDANIGVKLDSTMKEVAELRGLLEAQRHQLTQLHQAPLPSFLGVQQETSRRPNNPKEYLKLANEKAQGGQISLARRLYTELIHKWPKAPIGGEAHFGLGKTYFDEGQCREALYEYGKVIEDYPKSKMAPAAYLHSSDCFMTFKMEVEARMALQELRKQYPKSVEAKRAKQKLLKIKQQQKRKTR